MIESVTKSMIDAGEKMASDLMNAQVSTYMDGLGGSKTWDEWLAADVSNRDLILAYLNEEIVSVTAIYIAMHRAK